MLGIKRDHEFLSGTELMPKTDEEKKIYKTPKKNFVRSIWEMGENYVYGWGEAIKMFKRDPLTSLTYMAYLTMPFALIALTGYLIYMHHKYTEELKSIGIEPKDMIGPFKP
jgi:Ni,Fe-hydrogenase I cytochrome b subunit